MEFDAHDIARFWSKVDVVGEADCWLWRAGVRPDGYGDFKVRLKDHSLGAHRVAYAIFSSGNLSVLDGLVVRHSCDNRLCCNPFHLSTGTHADNVMDRVRRGRSAIGEGNGRHKLTEPDVRVIRQSGMSISALAEKYGVDRATIRAVLDRRSWRHVV